MLIGSGVRLSTSNPMHQFAAPRAGSVERAAWCGAGKLRNLQAGFASVSSKAGRPDGYRHPGSWSLPNKAGALSARYQTDLAMAGGSLNLAAGRNLDGSTALTITVPDADLQLVVSATGTAAITISQTGTLAGALYGTGTGAITLTVPASSLGAIVSAIATAGLTLNGAAAIRAVGVLAGDILPYTELSPEALAASVWGAVAASNDTAGTMGEKLNDAGSAANPWTEVIESGYTAAQIMRLLAAVAVGKTTIDASGSPVIVTFRDIADTKDRVVADMVDSERTAITIDET